MQSTKKTTICFFIFLSIVIVSPNVAKGEVDSASEIKQVSNVKNSNTVVVDLPPETFSFQGVKDIQSPVKIKLKDNKVDLSSVTTSLNRATESIYDNLHGITETIQTTYEEIVDFLCIKAKSKAVCMDDSIEKLKGIYHDIQASMSKEILYPYWYEEKDRDFTEAINFLTADCAVDCANSAIAKSIARGSDSKYHQLYNQIKNKDKKCQMNIVQRLADQFDLYNFPGECMEEKNKNHLVCKDMFKHVKATKNRFLEIMSLTYGEDALTKIQARAICIECASISNGSSNNLLLDAIKVAEHNLQCRDLKLNEEKIVFSGTELFVFSSYTVKKEVDGSYSVPLVLNFSPSEDYDGSVPQNKVSEYYMKKAQVCMKKANQKMLGPNGEKLKINIIPAPVKHNKNICDRQEIIDIAIDSSDMRSYSYHYAADIDCPTMTHEILHLLGLQDEYKEESRGFYIDSKTGKKTRPIKDKMKIKKLVNNKNYTFKNSYDCRVSHSNSIMSNMYERWENVYNSRTNESLLDPGHFNSILYGDCAINQHFNECSQLAYNDTYDHPTCTEKKRQCKSQNILGRNKQKKIEQIQTRIKELQRENISKPRIVRMVNGYEEKLSSLKEALQTAKSWPDL